jgi:hypothetical protein
MKNEYSISDLIDLKEIIDVRKGPQESYDFYLQVLDKAKKKLNEMQLDYKFIEDTMKSWLGSFGKVQGNRALSFIFDTDLNKVPLYINDKDLKMFVEWRLKIAK